MADRNKDSPSPSPSILWIASLNKRKPDKKDINYYNILHPSSIYGPVK